MGLDEDVDPLPLIDIRAIEWYSKKCNEYCIQCKQLARSISDGLNQICLLLGIALVGNENLSG